MNSAEKQTVLHCLKSMIDEEACEECPLYGMTGTDHCEKDCVRLAINALDQEPCEDAISREDALMALTGEWTDSTDELIHRFIKRIRTLPPVKPTEKVGQWEWNQYDSNPKIGNWHCSQCHGIGKAYYDYCPYCGSRMTQEVEE